MPSNCIFRGDALVVPQISSCTVTADDATTTYNITINGKSIGTLGTGVSAAATAAAIVANLAASQIPEFAEITWTNPSGATVTGTGGQGGTPTDITFTATSGVSGGAGTISAFSTSQTPAGPRRWGTPSNWSNGAVPVTGDSVYLRGNTGNIVDLLFDLDQTGVTLALLDIDSSYSGGHLGLPDWNPLGYYEYRNTFLKIGATTVNIGRPAGSGTGPSRVRLNTLAVQTTLNIYSTGSPDTGIPAVVDFVGTHASSLLNIQKGTVQAGWLPGGTTVLASILVGSQDNPATDATLYLGDYLTLGTMTAIGGAITLRNGATTIVQDSGVLTVVGTAGVTTLTSLGATVNYESSGTIGTYNGYSGSLLDVSRNEVSRTITNANFYGKAGYRDPLRTVIFTNSFYVEDMNLMSEFTVGQGRHYQIT